MRRALVCSAVLACSVGGALAADFTAEAINSATYSGGTLPAEQSPLTARVQILLDRHDASPGVIDGYLGENVRKAIRGFETVRGLPADGEMDEEVWRLLSQGSTPAVVRHAVTEDDISNIVEPLPKDYSKLAERDWLGFTSAAEKIAERFHMDIDFLKQLNAGADFSRPGTEIWVADPGKDATTAVGRLVADKSRQLLLAYDGSDNLISTYPVTIGSRQLPSPSGRHKVKAIAVEANYTYLPDRNFTQGDNTEKLILPPGPNNPIGLVWIDLSKPTYGIHGTPEPAEIDKEQSHGCVRMTNWDAMELAGLIDPGVPVVFQD